MRKLDENLSFCYTQHLSKRFERKSRTAIDYNIVAYVSLIGHLSCLISQVTQTSIAHEPVAYSVMHTRQYPPDYRPFRSFLNGKMQKMSVESKATHLCFIWLANDRFFTVY